MITDTRPARNAIGSFSVIEVLERLVDPTLVLGAERDRRRAHEAPRAFSTTHAPRAPARSRAASAPPSGITHASRSKPLVLGVERIVGPNSSTIASRICRSDWHAAMRCFTSDFISRATVGIGLVERRVTRRADEQRFQPALARVLRAGGCGSRERKRKRGHCDEPHDLSASRMPASSSFVEAGPVMCGGTTRPRLSMKKVSGTPVTPQLPNVVPTPSRMFA